MERKELLDFLYFLSHNKALTKAQQRKSLSLIAKVIMPLNPKAELPARKDDTIRFHNPKGVVDFLTLFSIDDSLKWYTHDWDKAEPFSIQSLIDNAENNLEKLRKFCFGMENKGVPATLFYHVWNFICPNQTKGILSDQFGKQFETRWADVVGWCKENPGVWPGTYVTPQGYSFANDINRFKRTIEFRTDVDSDQKFGFQIKSLIRKAISGAVEVDFTESFDSLGLDAKLYCNVKALYTGISKLCNWVASYKTKGDSLIVDLQYNDSCYYLTLCHKGSTMSGPQSKIDGLAGDFKTIREVLFSVCDFEISGLFNGTNIIITALDNSSQLIGNTIASPTLVKPAQENLHGVSYKLKLYV